MSQIVTPSMTIRLFISVLLLFPCALAEEQKWVAVRSPNFSVATDGGERRGREVALHFEQMRKIFGSLMGQERLNITAPLQIIAFKDRKGLNRVAPIWQGKPVDLAGIYLGSEGKHFIALDLSSEAVWPAVFHEYSHLLLAANYPPKQLWFDEGFAEYYSTIKINYKEVHIGDPPPGAVDLLHSGLMPVVQLFSVINESDDYYKTGQRRSLFYAESWLMVHYLFDTKKINQATEYFALIKKNVPVAEAINKAFGMPAADLDKSLKEYLGSSNALMYTIKNVTAVEEATFAAKRMKDFEIDSTIAEMHLHSPDHVAEAKQEFESILQRYPENAEAHCGLGIAYFAQQQYDQAGKEFRRAAALGSQDPRVYYYVAYFIYKRISPPGVVADPETLVDMNEALNKAIDLNPELADAYNLRSFVLLRARNYPQAIAAIKKAISLSPRNEQYKLNLANQYMIASHYDEAIALFDQLRSSADPEVAKTAATQMQTAKDWKAKPLLRLSADQNPTEDSSRWQRKPGASEDAELKKLEETQRSGGEHSEQSQAEADSRPMKFLKGTLVRVQCVGELLPSAILTVSAGGKSFKLTSASVAKIPLIGASGFSCGWRNRKVSVNYRADGPTTGEVVSLEVY